MRCSSSCWLAVLLAATLGMAAARSADAPAPAARPTLHASIAAASEVAASDRSLVLVIFGAEWCGPCRVLKKNVLANDEFLNRAGLLRMTEIDIDANEKAARDFNVEAVPTLVLMTSDGKIVRHQVGALDADGLLKWLEEGRQRAGKGQWEGTAPSTRINEFITRAAADRLSDDDVKRLIEMLGDSDPAERGTAARLIATQREQAMPPLIDALTNAYLGIRIGAGDLLHRLAPEAPGVDPWLAPSEVIPAAAACREWWSKAGKLPDAVASRPDPSTVSSVAGALEALRSNDPVKRTEGMSTLVTLGESSIPAIREAIKSSDKAGDHRTASLLEEVRWAILVTDELEERAHVRTVLARGSSLERQSAAGRLGSSGKDALPVLAELAGDSDPLVVESAVRALSQVGGKDTVPAMAALLKTANPNLRVTAAQALGHTKDKTAAPHLIAVLTDSNEVVATTALSSLEEIHSTEASFGFSSGSSQMQKLPEVTKALKGCLADARWRVRAAAAEVIGKLRVSDLLPDLRPLLRDGDPFVVKSALASLQAMGGEPDPQQLAETAQRLPAMRPDVVRMMAKSHDEAAVAAVTSMYQAAPTQERASILLALGERDRFDHENLADSWQPLLTTAAAEPDPSVRRATAGLLTRVGSNVAAQVVELLLGDKDAEVQSLAAASALECLAGRKSISGEDMEEMAAPDFESGSGTRTKSRATNVVLVSAEKKTKWHTLLLATSVTNKDAVTAAAIYSTGDGKADLPLLAESIRRSDRSAAKRLAKTPGMSLLLPRLPWPDGQAVLDALTNKPLLYVAAATGSTGAVKQVQDYLLDPARFSSSVAAATEDELAVALPLALASRAKGWSLAGGSPAAASIAQKLVESTNGAWRAAAVYALSRGGGAAVLSVLTNAAKDRDPWVRVAALRGLARGVTERPLIEQRLGQFVADPDNHVAQFAAMALLEPEIRSASSLGWDFSGFVYNRIFTSESYSTSQSEDRPLAALESTPAYLNGLLGRVETNTVEDALPFIILLAQHGRFEGLANAIKRHPRPGGERDQVGPALLVGIGLSRDTQFLPYVRGFMDATKDEWQLRSVLRALRGMAGPEVRQLRLDINRRLRKTAE